MEQCSKTDRWPTTLPGRSSSNCIMTRGLEGWQSRIWKKVYHIRDFPWLGLENKLTLLLDAASFLKMDLQGTRAFNLRE
jgi:hypothetical protein